MSARSDAMTGCAAALNDRATAVTGGVVAMTPVPSPCRRDPPGRCRAPRLATTAANAVASIALALLAGCAGFPQPAPTPPAVPVAAGWQAPLPQDGRIAELRRWWSQFDDPALDRIVIATEQASPTVASAASRIEQARAARVAARAALLPALDLGASASRGRQDVTVPVADVAGAALQAGWEIDVFGGNRAGRNAAEARLEGAAAAWHDARIVVAAETANEYVNLRACEARLVKVRADAASRAETARLTGLAASAGLESRANQALANAGAAQASANVTQQAEFCDRSVKVLVALTAIAEPELRGLLALSEAQLPEPASIIVPAVPAAALAQRPDVFVRGQDVVAASAEIAQFEAARLPRVVLSGSVGVASYRTSFGSVSGTTWSIGPLSVTLPVFDAGTRRADVVAARARYDAAVSNFAGTLRGAVREVETALLSLQSTARRSADAQRAADGFEAFVRAVDARYKSGFGTLFELEEARRNALTAQNALIELGRERVAAWIALYRALGGGWEAPPEASAGAAASSVDASLRTVQP